MKKLLSFTLAAVLVLGIPRAEATVSDTGSRTITTCNSATTVFTVPFRILDQGQVKVERLDNSTKAIAPFVLTTDYTVQNVGSVSTQVTTVATCATGNSLIFTRNMPRTQTTTYVANDPFPARTHEAALDKLTMLSQQNGEFLSRVPALPDYADAGLTPALPIPSDGKILYWSGTNGQIANSSSSITDFDAATTSAATSAAAAAASASSASSAANSCAAAVVTTATNATTSGASATAAAASASSASSSAASIIAGWKGPWVTSTAYAVGDKVSDGGSSYICILAHTSGASTEPGVGGSWTTNWNLLAAKGSPGAGTGDMLAANNLSDLANKATSRTNLGTAIGTNVQAWDTDLDALAGLTYAADKLAYFTGAHAAAVTTFTSAARTWVAAVDAAAERAILGLGTVYQYNVGTSANNVVQLDGSAKLPAVDGSALLNLPSSNAQVSLFTYTTAGGSSVLTPTTNAWTEMTINTTDYNNITSASRSSNQITLPAGKYNYEVDISFWNVNTTTVGGVQIGLWNVTDATLIGQRKQTLATLSGAVVTAFGYLEIAGSKTFALKYYVSGTGSTNIGYSSLTNDNVEWATIRFTKTGT